MRQDALNALKEVTVINKDKLPLLERVRMDMFANKEALTLRLEIHSALLITTVSVELQLNAQLVLLLTGQVQDH